MPQIQQTADLHDDRALFELALGPVNRTSVALCGGSPRGFADISYIYEVWHSLRIPVAFITPPHMEGYIPAGVPHAVSGLSVGPAQANEAWYVLDSAGLVIVGPNMQLTSAQQVFFSKLLPTTSVPTILTDEALSLWRIDRAIQGNPAIILLAEVGRLARMTSSPLPISERGIFGVQEFMQGLPVASDICIVYDAVRLYLYIRSSDTLIHTPLIGSVAQVKNLIISLLPTTLYARSRSVSLEDRARVMCALFAQILQAPEQTPAEWARIIRQKLS